MYRHVVFDVDGTILDTEKAILESFKNILKTRYNMEAEDKDIKFILGIPGSDNINIAADYRFDSPKDITKVIK